MRSRMERYKDLENEPQLSRSNKNKELYQNIGRNTRYANFTDITNSNTLDLSNVEQNSKTRENYHKMKEYSNVLPPPKVKKDLEEFNNLYQDHENKIYDINSVLEEARKNRLEKDALEEKRKLKNTSYNILANLNPEELEKYRKEKKEKVIKPNDKEIKELIDTITSKTLSGEIDKATSVSLLSDLMATSAIDKVEKPSQDDKEEIATEEENDDKLALSKEILDKEQLEQMQKLKDQDSTNNQNSSILKGADSDFYTRSMDLSDKDFEIDEEFKERKIPLPIKILLGLIVIAILVVAAIFIYKKVV